MTDPNAFIHSLAKYIAATASIEYASTPRALWCHQVDEVAGIVTDPHTVLKVTGGDGTDWSVLASMSLQAMTTAANPALALTRAQAVYECFLDAQRRPLRMLTINGFVPFTATANGTWRILSANPIQSPGIIGLDAKGRSLVSFNVDVTFLKLT